jgi:hypothetical protein
MGWDWAALAIGVAITAATLFDVFATVVVPGRVAGPINAPRLLRTFMFRFWRGVLKLCSGRDNPRMDSVFGAMLLLLVLLAWVALTLLGLSFAAWALRSEFRPPITSYGDAAFQIGMAMMTLGLSGHSAVGWARALVVAAGLCGFQIITLTLSFIVQIQTALRDRDALVLKLASRAGTPPSGVALLVTTRELDARGGLPQLFDRWEDWSAAVLYTHAAHPVLSYFRSDEGVIDWLTSLGAVLDAASVTLAMLDDAPQGNARLMHHSGVRTILQLCRAFRLDPRNVPELTDAEIGQAAARLREAGYTVLAGREAELRELQRAYRGELAALTRHFGVDMPAWVGKQEECPASDS